MKSLSRAAVIAAVRKTSLTVAAVGNWVVLRFSVLLIMAVLTKSMQQISAKAMGEYRTDHQLEGLPKICNNKKRGQRRQ